MIINRNKGLEMMPIALDEARERMTAHGDVCWTDVDF